MIVGDGTALNNSSGYLVCLLPIDRGDFYFFLINEYILLDQFCLRTLIFYSLLHYLESHKISGVGLHTLFYYTHLNILTMRSSRAQMLSGY